MSLPPIVDAGLSSIDPASEITPFFWAKKISRSKCSNSKPATLLMAARHNRRAIQCELGAESQIDATRSRHNVVLAGPDSAEAIAILARRLIAEAGIGSLRKDHVQAIEFVFSLPASAGALPGFDMQGYFRWCLSWTQSRFPHCPVLSADLHLDESAPHCHVLLLPLVEGKMVGSGLMSRSELPQHRDAFETAVHAIFGFQKMPRALTGPRRQMAAKIVMGRLRAICDPVLDSALRAVVTAGIHRDPRPALSALGLELPPVVNPTRRKTVVQIFTAPGRGPKVERASRSVR